MAYVGADWLGDDVVLVDAVDPVAGDVVGRFCADVSGVSVVACLQQACWSGRVKVGLVEQRECYLYVPFRRHAARRAARRNYRYGRRAML